MRVRRLGAIGTAVAVLIALTGIWMPLANATTTPPWEPDANSLGAVVFYDASGNVVTNGADLTSMWSFAQASNDQFQGSSVGSQGFVKAFAYFAWPSHTAPTSNWFTGGSSAATRFPNTSAGVPAALSASTNPVVDARTNGDSNFAGFQAAGTNDPTTGYDHMIQVRVAALGVGAATVPQYWETDIMVNTVAGTWTQVYPAPAAAATSTSTSVTASPASPQAPGTSVTFHATVAPSAAAGTVQFLDGTTPLGSPVAVSTGSATLTTSALSTASHSITAAFTPTTPASYQSSTSTAITYVISAPAVTTGTALTVTPAGPITVGTASTLHASVTPSSAAGTVQFFDGATTIGSPVTVVSGAASSAATTLTVNTHQLSAVFTPTSAAAFTASTSNTISYTVNAVAATPTSTSLSVTPPGPQSYGSPVTLSATVSPSAAGTVNFLDGTTVVGTATVSSGTASDTLTTLGAGTDSLTATFVPTSPASFAGSTSAVVNYTVTPATTTVSVAASPASTAVAGANVTITATTTPPGAAGSVQFSYNAGAGSTPIGSPVAVSAGSATLITSALPQGSDAIKAAFTPSGGNYAASTSLSLTYTITAPPPGNTSTALQVTPAGPVGPGTLETLAATVTPASAAGLVTFFDGTTMLGSSVDVSGGLAQSSVTLPVGAHSLIAMFTPSSAVEFTSSASLPQSYTVEPPASATQTSLAVTPGATEPFGTSMTFTATVMPVAAGSVQFMDGTSLLGTVPVTVGSSSATATFTTVGLAGGSHNVTAVFVPTAPLFFLGSTSTAQTVTISAVATVSLLAVSPIGPVTAGTSVELTDTLTPASAAGLVTFSNGSTVLGTATVSSGKASFTTTSLPQGMASLTASFVPAVAADFIASASAALTLSVVAPPTFVASYANGQLLVAGGTVMPGASIQVHAVGFQPGETITVELHSGTIPMGTVTASPMGAAMATVVLPLSLPVGSHTITLAGSIATATFPFVLAAAAVPTPTPSSTGSGSILAQTGTDIGLGVLAGLLLLLAGAVLLVGVRSGRFTGLHQRRG